MSKRINPSRVLEHTNALSYCHLRLKEPVGPELQKIFDRGIDGAFTIREELTFRLLHKFIADKWNPLYDRARACWHYDTMMGVAEDVGGIARRWYKEGEQAVVDEFLKSMEE